MAKVKANTFLTVPDSTVLMALVDTPLMHPDNMFQTIQDNMCPITQVNTEDQAVNTSMTTAVTSGLQHLHTSTS